MRRLGRQLHQADRARRRLGVRPELRLLVDDGRDQRRVEPMLACVHTNELGVPERIADPLVPRRLGREHIRGCSGGDRDQHDKRDQSPHVGASSSMTEPTNASSSSNEPDVLVRVVGARDLLAVVEQPRFAIVGRHLRPRAAKLRRRSDHDHLVEPRVTARLVEERHLSDAHRRRVGQCRQLVAPAQVLGRDERMQRSSSQASASRSLNTTVASAPRSISPSGATIPFPIRATTASRTSGRRSR